MAKTEKPDTSPEARQEVLHQLHNTVADARDILDRALKTISELSFAATLEETERLEAKLAAAREAAGKGG